VDFVKMEGLGNDFVVVDGPADLSAEAVTRLCDRRFGVGADGVLEITRRSPHRIGMRYWNADGGEAEMCGNGLRCVARLAVERGWVAGADLVVETAAGDMAASVRADGSVRALVGVPERVGEPFDAEGFTVHAVRVGNPHAVVFVDDVEGAPVRTAGRRLECHDAFPERANVEFVRVLGGGELQMRVWERGVGETLASGTGATAAAFASVAYRDLAPPVLVHLPGGDLTIEFDDGQAWMVGPANVVYTGTVTP
jgi:diaminopimelate epimerase